jgi:hypothetical protein
MRLLYRGSEHELPFCCRSRPPRHRMARVPRGLAETRGRSRAQTACSVHLIVGLQPGNHFIELLIDGLLLLGILAHLL